MTELALELDEKAATSINDLMIHYQLESAAQLISKALTVLSLAAHIDNTQGELFARKGGHETKIVVR
ncbi:MAG TPA: hypothetical protein VKR58_10055 [Aquella sp.]|jgi:hypothetical protein|nr:hypothetical protein [Aquella sp.]